MSDTLASPVAADENRGIPSRPRREKMLRWSHLIAKFVSVQIVVQALGLAAGILLVRTLSQREYAFFTIANTMQGTIGVLADSGISIGLSAIGGRVWQDRYRFGQLLNTALYLRKFLAGAAVFIITPILIWMLIRAGASAVYAFCIAGAILLGVSAQLTTGVLEVVPRMHSQVSRLQKMDLYSTLSRLVLLGGAYLSFLNASVAVVIASVSLLQKRYMLSRWVAGDVDMQAPRLEADRKEIVGIVKSQLPNAIFYCVQGQVTIWLISIFGNTASIAEVGALGRLAVVFTIIGSVLSNIVSPAFARCQSYTKLVRQYWMILGLYAAFSAVLFSLTLLFPEQILWILGGQYKSLKNELTLIVLSSIVGSFAAVVWALNMAKGWIKNAWLYIPVTISTQAVLLGILNVRTVAGVILFGLFTTVPSIGLNFYMTHAGLKTQREYKTASQ